MSWDLWCFWVIGWLCLFIILFLEFLSSLGCVSLVCWGGMFSFLFISSRFCRILDSSLLMTHQASRKNDILSHVSMHNSLYVSTHNAFNNYRHPCQNSVSSIKTNMATYYIKPSMTCYPNFSEYINWMIS